MKQGILAMARPTIGHDELIDKLADVFRTYGYEGASLSRISEATGLEKASLYHRFPGGKDDMVAAVVAHVGKWFQNQVFTPLERSGEPAERVRFVAERLREFYGEGQKSCALNSLSLPGGSAALHEALRTALTAWLQAFTGIARASGATAREARKRAEQAITEIQGSLVLARVLGDCGPFRSAIGRLPELLTGGRR
jgi:AcrR family transcriptional regulator